MSLSELHNLYNELKAGISDKARLWQVYEILDDHVLIAEEPAPSMALRSPSFLHDSLFDIQNDKIVIPIDDDLLSSFYYQEMAVQLYLLDYYILWDTEYFKIFIDKYRANTEKYWMKLERGYFPFLLKKHFDSRKFNPDGSTADIAPDLAEFFQNSSHPYGQYGMVCGDVRNANPINVLKSKFSNYIDAIDQKEYPEITIPQDLRSVDVQLQGKPLQEQRDILIKDKLDNMSGPRSFNSAYNYYKNNDYFDKNGLVYPNNFYYMKYKPMSTAPLNEHIPHLGAISHLQNIRSYFNNIRDRVSFLPVTREYCDLALKDPQFKLNPEYIKNGLFFLYIEEVLNKNWITRDSRCVFTAAQFKHLIDVCNPKSYAKYDKQLIKCYFDAFYFLPYVPSKFHFYSEGSTRFVIDSKNLTRLDVLKYNIDPNGVIPWRVKGPSGRTMRSNVTGGYLMKMLRMYLMSKEEKDDFIAKQKEQERKFKEEKENAIKNALPLFHNLYQEYGIMVNPEFNIDSDNEDEHENRRRENFGDDRSEITDIDIRLDYADGDERDYVTDEDYEFYINLFMDNIGRDKANLNKIVRDLSEEEKEAGMKSKYRYNIKIDVDDEKTTYDVFRATFGAMNMFHLAAVRQNFDGEELLFVPSAMMAMATAICPDLRYFTTKYGNPMEIVSKYAKRGLSIILNDVELAQMYEYRLTSITDFEEIYYEQFTFIKAVFIYDVNLTSITPIMTRAVANLTQNEFNDIKAKFEQEFNDNVEKDTLNAIMANPGLYRVISIIGVYLQYIRNISKQSNMGSDRLSLKFPLAV